MAKTTESKTTGKTKAADNPFLFDMAQFMPSFDPATVMDEFTKATASFKMPGIDMDGLMAAQKKNMDALAIANTKAFESAQTVAQRQSEILQQALNAATQAASDVTQSATPQEAAAKQTELYKAAVETALENMRDVSDMVAQAHMDVSDTINTRFSESLDELKTQIIKLKT